jgi:hypothetical protein
MRACQGKLDGQTSKQAEARSQLLELLRVLGPGAVQAIMHGESDPGLKKVLPQ